MPRVTITVPGKTSQPYRFQLDRQVVALGRGEENDIAIDSGSVSAHHAEMHRIGGGYELRDVGSTNGIKLNGSRQDVIRLRNGSDVKIGDVEFGFLLSDEETETLAAETPRELPPIMKESEAPPAPMTPRHTYTPTVASSGGGVLPALTFVILAAAAFFAGLAVRYQKDTGGSLIDAMLHKPAAITAPATPGTPAPAEPPPSK